MPSFQQHLIRLEKIKRRTLLRITSLSPIRTNTQTQTMKESTMTNIKSEIMTITPSQAERWLDKNPKNRTMNKTRIEP